MSRSPACLPALLALPCLLAACASAPTPNRDLHGPADVEDYIRRLESAERVERALSSVGHGHRVARPADGCGCCGDGVGDARSGRGATELVGGGDDAHPAHAGSHPG